MAHLLRELRYLMELYGKHGSSRDFADLLRQALKLRFRIEADHAPCPEEKRGAIMERFNQLLTEPPDPDHGNACTFFKRMLRNREHLFVLLSDLAVPSDNNSS